MILGQKEFNYLGYHGILGDLGCNKYNSSQDVQLPKVHPAERRVKSEPLNRATNTAPPKMGGRPSVLLFAQNPAIAFRNLGLLSPESLLFFVGVQDIQANVPAFSKIP